LPANFQAGRRASRHVAIGNMHGFKSRTENDLPVYLDYPEDSEPDEPAATEVSTHRRRRRSSHDIDQEFDNMLTTLDPEGSHLDHRQARKKATEAWERKPRRNETYADGVVQMQEALEKLKASVKERFGDMFTDQEIKDGTIHEADVNMSVHRVQGKIVALRAMRSLLDALSGLA